jgi:serpin B
MKALIVFGLFLLACGVRMSSWAAEEQGARETAATAVVVQGNTAFALDLYGQLRSRAGNLFFSPLSLSTALAMTYAGARGQTAEQMATVLHFPANQEQMHQAFAAVSKGLLDDNTDKKYQLHIANALWGQKGYHFREAFLQTTRTYYGAGLNEVDFQTAAEQARQTINAWVEEQTKEKIKDLIPPGALDALTRLVLTNAIYFKGDWVLPFKKEETKDEVFTVSAAQQVTVPMMQQTAFFKYLDGEGFQALELPYVGDTLSMVVFLPKKLDGLAEFEQSLSVEKLTSWLSELESREVVVALPKFTMTVEFALKEVLSAMGMWLAFSGEADFAGISEAEKLYISDVFHKAFVDVSEEGTEAAAATGVVARATAAGPPPAIFRADHPFVFLIRDVRTRSILFLGRVVQPKE